MRREIIISMLFFCVAISVAKAQFKDVGKFLAGGPEDASKLMEGYLGPYFNAFGASLTGGWYNTAKTHKIGGFDITATFNTAIIPSSDKSFNIDELALESLRIAPGASSTTPTIAGSKNVGTQLNYNFPDPIPETKAFDMPQGTGWGYIPSPMLQLGLGLIKDTEIMGRYMPTFSQGDGKVGMWGIGGKHGLKQWIPVIKKVPVLHLTLHYGYTKLNANYGLTVTPADIGATDLTTTANWDDQGMEFITQSHTGNLLISADLPIVAFYGGIGFATTKTNLSLSGDYPVIDPTSGLAVTDNSFLTNPIDMEIRNSDGSKTKPRFNVGVRFKFAVVTLHFDYTYAYYSMATAGLGISFR